MKIQHDFHLHTNLSVCAPRDSYAKDFVANARENGLKKIGFANHFWDSAIEGANSFYKTQDFEHLELLKPELAAIDTSGLKVYYGCEAEYDPVYHGVAMREEIAERFDYIIVPNSHTHMMMPKDFYQPYKKHLDFMITAYEDIISCNISRYITAMAHPFAAVACPYGFDPIMEIMPDDEYKRLFDKTAKKGIAIEINMSSFPNLTKEQIDACQHMRMYRRAKECGCKFIFGSDAHRADGRKNYAAAEDVAEVLGLCEQDIAEVAR